MLIFGVRLFGRSEIVPGVFFIATRFFHVCFIPLIPMQSFVIFQDADDAGGDAALPVLHWGSISIAWLRQLLLVGAAVLGYLAWTKLEAHVAIHQVQPMLLIALGCIAGFAGSYRMAHANPESLEALRSVGVPAHVLTRAKKRLGR